MTAASGELTPSLCTGGTARAAMAIESEGGFGAIGQLLVVPGTGALLVIDSLNRVQQLTGM
ncbi:MAG: hypothetical protein A2289_26960 [Deltaproteobacteria bacterium RIFOXYA12_FULL_58_15]|nr:MAG: hypothetical protein A2289_26960 [Deltaproteobacteria bacterium RIFOXYA12_FULL_58_15]OGR13609.1 MAG: hypothetical protein A2341_22645 [Deltaproteobacteria bacterium RIFOXYB12_FULL_58_9]